MNQSRLIHPSSFRLPPSLQGLPPARPGPRICPGRRDPGMELARNLKIDSVERLRPSRPLLLGRTRPVAAAVALMRQHRAGCLLVVEADRLVGNFTERDLLLRRT